MNKVYRLALTGSPIGHSRSPAIQKVALELAGLQGEYQLIEGDESGLDDLLERLRHADLAGLNVTMPLKGAAAAACDRLTVEAEVAGSVNCLRFRGVVEGHSTDQVAFAEAVATPAFSQIDRVLVLGSGGSARAALAALEGRSVHVSARNQVAAAALAAEFDSRVVAWGDAVAGALLINATPLGMSGEPLHRSVVADAEGLIDLPYASGRTRAVDEMEQTGRPFIDGYEFLARTARASFGWWTNTVVELQPLIRAARNG